MKKVLFFLTLVGFLATQAYATPKKIRKTKAPQVANLKEQLANYISLPDAFGPGQPAGVVVIQFRINSDSEIGQLAVFSHNKQIGTSLLKQLTGKKVVGYEGSDEELHTVRLRFRP